MAMGHGIIDLLSRSYHTSHPVSYYNNQNNGPLKRLLFKLIREGEGKDELIAGKVPIEDRVS